MGKMTCLSGAVVGKIGGFVYSVNSGQQIVRAYQPNVANPSTELQVSNRSKFKLASQLAAVFAPVLAISKNGVVSGRSQFVSDTMSHITVQQDTADIQLSKLQLTKSQILIPSIVASVDQSLHIQAALGADVTAMGVVRMVYAVFEAWSINKLMLASSHVVSVAGADGTFPADLGAITDHPTFIYAYGIIESEENALAKYQDYQLDNAEFIASLVSSRSNSASSLKTTMTRYYVINRSSNSVGSSNSVDPSTRNPKKGEK